MSDRDDLLSALRSALPGLRRKWPIRQLAIFGSMARGEATSESDLDVLVDFERPVILSDFVALEDRLAARAGRPVDLVSRPALKRFMGERILAEALPV